MPGELPAAVDALGLGRRQQHGDVVAGLAVAGGEHVALGGLAQHPVAGRVAGTVQIGAQADEVVVHVDGDGGRRGDVGDAPLQPVDLGEVEPEPAELGRDRGEQIAARPQLLEVLGEERVVAVVLRRPLVEAGEHLVGQQLVGARRRLDGGGHVSLLS